MAGHEEALARNLFGNYEILNVVGRGGMGIVYRALDLALDRVVALKVLRGDLHTRPLLVARFQREAQAVAQLTHSNIVETYSTGVVERIPYIAMELIDGLPLSEVMKQERRLPWDRALGLAEQVSRALACAHEARIIHRDIKPPNILITADDHVYVTDFGLAKLLTIDTQLTAQGARLGTPQYMSPEQCCGIEATPASDLYSLGVVLFVMIAGRLPYRNTEQGSLINAVVSANHFRLRELAPNAPEEVERLVAYLLEKDPKNRPSSAAELGAAIERVRQGKPLDPHAADATTKLSGLRQTRDGSKGPHAPKSAAARVFSACGRVGEKVTAGWKAFPAGVRGVLLSVTVAALGAVAGAKAGAFLYPDPRIDWPQATRESQDRWRQAAEVAYFDPSGADAMTAHINLAGFDVTDLRWTGDYAVAFLDGRNGTPRVGERSVCQVAPALQYASLAFPPISAMDVSVRAVPDALTGGGGAASKGTPYAGRFLVRCGSETGARKVLACTGGKGEPLEIFGPQGAGAAFVVSSADLSADGSRVAAGVKNQDGTWSVLQGQAGGDTSALTSLTSGGAYIQAIYYAPDASRLVYVRDAGQGRSQVWTVATDGTERDGRILAEGLVSVAPQAFSPDSGRLVIHETLGGGAHALRILNLSDGHIEGTLDNAQNAAWHPSGQSLIAIAPDTSNQPQLWRLPAPGGPTQQSQPPKQLTTSEAGVLPICAISPEGHWAATIPQQTQDPQIIFAAIR